MDVYLGTQVVFFFNCSSTLEKACVTVLQKYVK